METLQVERDGGIVTVTLNKPEKKNASPQKVVWKWRVSNGLLNVSIHLSMRFRNMLQPSPRPSKRMSLTY